MTSAGKGSPNRLAHILAQISVAGYGLFRILDALAAGDRRIALIAFFTIFIVMNVTALLHYMDRWVEESFSIPLMIFLANIASSFLMGSFIYYFAVYIGICCVGALYFNPRRIRHFLIFSNIVSIVLLIFKIPLTHPVRVIPFTEVMVHWFISIIASVFLYIVVVFASDKNTIAIRALDSFSALLSTTVNKIVLLDSMNRVTYISKSLLDIAGLKSADMAEGRPIFDLFDNEEIKTMMYDILKKEDEYEGTREVRINGEGYFFDVITCRLPNNTQGRLVNIIDITPAMKAKLEAESASRSKSTFLATMSHEIRTPLNAIIGLSEIELQKKLPLETHRDLEKIFNSGSSLLAIINDILDISKIEAGSFEMLPAEYDLPSMVNDTVHLNVVRIGSKNILFKLEIDATIPVKLFGDEVRVKQILNNLLSNAIKYTELGSVIFRILWERKQDEAWITFTVTDTGHGIKEEDIPRLFSEYSQLDAQANRYIEGTGLGLSITQNLVKLMGGVIGVQSVYGQGSVFTVKLPQRIVDETPIGEETARNLEFFRFMENRRSRGRLIRSYMPYGKVLVVDDVETNLDVVRGLMLPYGLSIDCASSGNDAIEKIRAGEPVYDVVFMDHMMPGMDGVEAVRIIRGGIDSDYARKVPIIALTANALAGNEEMFLSSGFNAYISKPIDIMQLDVALNTWVRNKQSEETLRLAELEQAGQDPQEAEGWGGVLEGQYLDGVDLVMGTERYNGEAVYLDILRSYWIHTPPLLEKLRNPSPETLGEYTVAVHGLKGSSYGICANSVGKEAEDLEAAARGGDLETVLADTGPLVETVKLLLLDLEGLIQKAAASRKAQRLAPFPDPGLLSRLLDAVRRYRTSSIEEILRELESFEYEAGGELVVWLREQMDNLEYDMIRERLEAAGKGTDTRAAAGQRGPTAVR
jgi:PAS domain S-box-containing protein